MEHKKFLKQIGKKGGLARASKHSKEEIKKWAGIRKWHKENMEIKNKKLSEKL
jgi:hypothetical protein